MRFLSPDFWQRLSPVKFFVSVALLFGAAFLLITPPLQGADEIAHFYRAYQISEGRFISEYTPDSRVGGYLPADFNKIVEISNYRTIKFHPDLKYQESRTKLALEMPTSHKKVFIDFPASSSYPPTAYPLASFGIIVSRLMNLPTIASLYAARLGCLITWIVLMGAAIYMIPRRKWALTAVGLLPMALFQAATLNGDAITLGSLAFMLALILKIRSEKKVMSHYSAAALIAAAIIMVLSKNIMFIFLPLVLLLRTENFKRSISSYWFKIALLTVPLLTFGLWLLAIRSLPSPVALDNSYNPAKQLYFIATSPQSFVNVMWNTYFYTWGDSITRSFIGNFGWADAPLSESIATIGYLGLFLLFAGSYERNYKEFISKRDKILLVSLAIVYWAVASTALYLYYSPVGFKIIIGLQGRYYIPIALMLIPVLRLKSIRIDPLWYRKLAVILPVTLLLASTMTLYVRYFVHNV